MPDTTSSQPPPQPELRVTIIVPLPADPFDQAEVLEKLRPVIDRAQHDLDDNVDTPITVDRRIVRPKPAKPAGGAA